MFARTPIFLLLLLVAALATTPLAPAQAGADPAGFEGAAAILARIHAPRFESRQFPITDFGAVADGSTDCTGAIENAIAACSAAGGGRVRVPAGVFLTGAIHLRSNVELHVSEGATLRFNPDPASYLPVVLTRFEGIECMNFSPLIYAFEQENVAVTGSGILDGCASKETWWAWNAKSPGKPTKQVPDRAQLDAMGQAGVPVAERVFGAGHFLRPVFIQPYRCKNVLIEGVRIINSPMWEINPVLCVNVTVRGVAIRSLGTNNDGCDPESCRDVLIEDCIFETGDDCIAIKSGRNNDGRRVGVAAENIVIRRCTMKDGHGGVTMGSEISGGCRNVFVEDCRMDSVHLDRAFRFKSNAVRGGMIENVFVRNVQIGRVVKAVLSVEFDYEEGAKGDFPPKLRNVVFENVKSESSGRVSIISGFAGAVIENLRFVRCAFRGVEAADLIKDAAPPAMQDTALELIAKAVKKAP